MRLFLALRALFFVALLPGTVTVLVPYRILVASGEWHLATVSSFSIAASVLVIAGAAVLLRCVWDFFATGRGTLAPVDPPRVLVVQGLYRYTRNPMYNAVIAMLAGEAWFFLSVSVLTYALLVLIAVHLFVVVYEEPILEHTFGQTYRAYRDSVPRWGLTFHPYRPQARRGS